MFSGSRSIYMELISTASLTCDHLHTILCITFNYIIYFWEISDLKTQFLFSCVQHQHRFYLHLKQLFVILQFIKVLNWTIWNTLFALLSPIQLRLNGCSMDVYLLTKCQNKDCHYTYCHTHCKHIYAHNDVTKIVFA